MATLTSTPAGQPCWIDIFTSDPDATRTFYGGLFGWVAEAPDEEYGGYFNFHKNGALVAGGMANDGSEGAPDTWTTYLAVDHADKAAVTIEATGGTFLVPPMDVMALGRMGVFAGPDGGVLGLWQPGEHRGFQIYDEPGAPGWFELHTRNYSDAIKFYTNTFGWDIHAVSDTPEFRYSTFGKDEEARAGIRDASNSLPEGVPCHWSVYFKVEDAEESVALVAKLGGTVVHGPEDTPYGRLAEVIDPTGVGLKLVSGD